MNLISTLWIIASLCAFILAADGLCTRFLPRMRSRSFAAPRLVPFSIIMLAIAIGCLILGLYEATA